MNLFHPPHALLRFEMLSSTITTTDSTRRRRSDDLFLRLVVLATALLLVNTCQAQNLSGSDDAFDGDLEIPVPSDADEFDHLHDDDDDEFEGVHFRILPGQLKPNPVRHIGRKRRPPRPADMGPVRANKNYQQLILLLRFKGHENRDLPPRETYETIFNKVGGHPKWAPHGSVLDYSREVSYDNLSVQTTVVGWIDLPHEEHYYAQRDTWLERIESAIKFALDKLERENTVDFRKFEVSGDPYIDKFGIIHSGYGAEFSGKDAYGTPDSLRIRSHQSRIHPWTSPSTQIKVSHYTCVTGLRYTNGSTPCRVGVLAHEIAHLGDLVDLYDLKSGVGIGAWGLLGLSDGFYQTGHTPTHLNPYAKAKFNWIKPEVLTEPGTYTVHHAEFNKQAYRIDKGFPPGEYILIENRQPCGFDSELPGGIGGLAIWHIDENKKTNRRGSHPWKQGWPQLHYRVALVQADGNFDLERAIGRGDPRDLFRGDVGGVNEIDWTGFNALRPYATTEETVRVRHRISEISNSGPVMTFRYDVEELPETPQNPAEALTMIDHASVVTKSFTEHDQVATKGTGRNETILAADLNLEAASVVYFTGSTTVLTSEADSTVVTGLADDSGDLWKDSVRITSLNDSAKQKSLTTNSRRRLAAGQHRLRWIVRSQHPLQFAGGATLTIQAFQVPDGN